MEFGLYDDEVEVYYEGHRENQKSYTTSACRPKMIENNFRNRGDKETDLGWELVVERSEFRPECTDSCGLWDDEETVRNILQIQDELNL